MEETRESLLRGRNTSSFEIYFDQTHQTIIKILPRKRFFYLSLRIMVRRALLWSKKSTITHSLKTFSHNSYPYGYVLARKRVEIIFAVYVIRAHTHKMENKCNNNWTMTTPRTFWNNRMNAELKEVQFNRSVLNRAASDTIQYSEGILVSIFSPYRKSASCCFDLTRFKNPGFTLFCISCCLSYSLHLPSTEC